MNHKFLMGGGVLLLLFGAATPFLMVMGLVKSTYLLNFLSFTASLAGLFMGLVGIAIYRQMNRKQ
jgi:hypothetical protein